MPSPNNVLSAQKVPSSRMDICWAEQILVLNVYGLVLQHKFFQNEYMFIYVPVLLRSRGQ